MNGSPAETSLGPRTNARSHELPMSSHNLKATPHITQNEALIFERSQTGRKGYRLPALDVEETPLDECFPPTCAATTTSKACPS